jgi:hypothetical protein
MLTRFYRVLIDDGSHREKHQDLPKQEFPEDCYDSARALFEKLRKNKVKYTALWHVVLDGKIERPNLIEAHHDFTRR